MFGQFTGKNEPHSGLDLPRSDRGLLVVSSEPGSFLCQLLKDIVYEAVHNTHGFAGDSYIWMNLFQDLEYINLIGFDALLRSFLLLVSDGSTAFLWELLSGLGFLLGRCLLGQGFLLFRGLLGGWLLLRRLLLCSWRHQIIFRENERKFPERKVREYERKFETDEIYKKLRSMFGLYAVDIMQSIASLQIPVIVASGP
ncbi:hypothetical protein F8388_009839 [Cannabis sativa]|uniref:Uncharacterized protein n=1 Tax=Cannabis sativa TaxID=3483 RepID=A0A7J6H364_CANSA|nr:hypothetical protein F8388_009839 [Cannabis sativa]